MAVSRRNPAQPVFHSPDEQAGAAEAVSGCSPEFVVVPGLSGRVALAVAHLQVS